MYKFRLLSMWMYKRMAYPSENSIVLIIVYCAALVVTICFAPVWFVSSGTVMDTVVKVFWVLCFLTLIPISVRVGGDLFHSQSRDFKEFLVNGGKEKRKNNE